MNLLRLEPTPFFTFVLLTVFNLVVAAAAVLVVFDVDVDAADIVDVISASVVVAVFIKVVATVVGRDSLTALLLVDIRV